MSKQDNRTCILVLGMHRSGTSALTGVLSMLDVYLGSETVSPSKDNPKGYFENSRVNLFNQELLKSINSSWDDIFFHPDRLMNLDHGAELGGILEEEFRYSRLFAIKDPRIALLFPLYADTIKKTGTEIKIIIPFRNPLEVAASLHKRDNMSVEKGLLLWIYHFLLAEKHSRGYRRVFVEFDMLLKEPKEMIRTVSRHLDIDFDSAYEQNRQQIKTFLEPGLKHHNISTQNFSQNVPDIIMEIVSRKSRFNEDRYARFFDAMRKRLFDYQHIFYNNEVVETFQRLKETSEHLERCRAELREQKDNHRIVLEGKNLHVEQLERAVFSRDTRVEDLNRKILSREHRIGELEDSLVSREHRIGELEDSLVSRDHRIGELENQAGLLRAELALVFQSNSWKITKGLRWVGRFVSNRGKNDAEKAERGIDKTENSVAPSENEIKPIQTTDSEEDDKRSFADAELYGKLWSEGAVSTAGKLTECDAVTVAPEALHNVMAGVVFPVEMESPEVSIIVPVYNSCHQVVECLLSLLKFYPACPWELIIADDCSTEADVEEVFSRRNDLRYIRQGKNVGFLKNVNLAVAEAKGKYVLLLNSDVQLLNDIVTVFLAEMDGDPGVGLVGPKILFPDGRLQEAGGKIDKTCRMAMIGFGGDPNDRLYDFRREVDYLSGACWFFRKELFATSGGLDEEYAPAYVEDVDFCARITAEGKTIVYVPEARIMHHLSVSYDSLSSDFKIVRSAVNRAQFIEKYAEHYKEKSRLKIIAFYLPQFHPCPENDFWWGKNYTEWVATSKASPLFRNHYQPHVPAELGYYNLTDTEVFEKQAALARRYSIHGFCFYYYNFNGRELLDRALDTFLASKADINFCLCWANENWTRRWDGQDNEILMKQDDGLGNNSIHIIKGIERFVVDDRYIRVDGKPLVLVYRVSLLENVRTLTAAWREYWLKKYREELYICLVDSAERALGESSPPEKLGFDAAVEFPVHNAGAGIDQVDVDFFEGINCSGGVYNYHEAVKSICSRPHPGYKRFPGCFPSWDNTPRKKNDFWVFNGAHPSAFQYFVEQKAKEADVLRGDEKMLFVNAWNEWGEGAHLEPDMKFGHSWLQVIDRVVKDI